MNQKIGSLIVSSLLIAMMNSAIVVKIDKSKLRNFVISLIPYLNENFLVKNVDSATVNTPTRNYEKYQVTFEPFSEANLPIIAQSDSATSVDLHVKDIKVHFEMSYKDQGNPSLQTVKIDFKIDSATLVLSFLEASLTENVPQLNLSLSSLNINSNIKQESTTGDLWQNGVLFLLDWTKNIGLLMIISEFIKNKIPEWANKSVNNILKKIFPLEKELSIEGLVLTTYLTKKPIIDKKTITLYLDGRFYSKDNKDAILAAHPNDPTWVFPSQVPKTASITFTPNFISSLLHSLDKKQLVKKKKDDSSTSTTIHWKSTSSVNCLIDRLEVKDIGATYNSYASSNFAVGGSFSLAGKLSTFMKDASEMIDWRFSDLKLDNFDFTLGSSDNLMTNFLLDVKGNINTENFSKKIEELAVLNTRSNFFSMAIPGYDVFQGLAFKDFTIAHYLSGLTIDLNPYYSEVLKKLSKERNEKRLAQEEKDKLRAELKTQRPDSSDSFHSASSEPLENRSSRKRNLQSAEGRSLDQLMHLLV